MQKIVYILFFLFIYTTNVQAWFWQDKNIQFYKKEYNEDTVTVINHSHKIYTKFEYTKKLLLNFSTLKKGMNNNIDFFEDLLNEWNYSKREIESLYKEFITSVKSADNYLLKIKEETKLIATKERRELEDKKNIQLENKYIVRLKRSKAIIEQLNIANIRLKDTIIQLKLKVARMEFPNQSDFTNYDNIFQSMKQDFNSLDKLGQELINENF